MPRKKPPLRLRRPADAVDPKQAERFVSGAEAAPEAVARPVADAPAHADPRAAKRPNAKAPVMASKAMVYRKRTDDLRRRMTIYLPEDLSRRLRIYAAEKDQDYSVVLAEALAALLDRKGVR